MTSSKRQKAICRSAAVVSAFTLTITAAAAQSGFSTAHTVAVPNRKPATNPLDPATRTKIFSLVDRQAPQIASDALQIWKYAEVGFKETKSSGLLQTTLKKAGFTIHAGVAGMPTAFVARFRSGTGGPVIGIVAEFDALPGISQVASATSPTPIPGVLAGHACGHNLLGAGSVGAAIAVANWLREAGVNGEVRVYGSPAEEGGDGKAFMVRAGLYKDVDIVLHWHPGGDNQIPEQTLQSNIKTDFTFHGLSSHAAGAPEYGRSALAAVEIMDMAANYMRQFTPNYTRIHNVIVNGGGAPNVIPNETMTTYYVRHPDPDVVRSLEARLVKAAQGAAIATETTVDWKIRGGVYPVLVNKTLDEAFMPNLEAAVSELSWTPEETRYANEIQKSMKVAPQDGANTTVSPLGEIRRDLGGSTDVGDISYTVPTVGFWIAAYPKGTPPHTWASTASAGSSIGTKGATIAAKAMAASAVQLFLDPSLIARAKDDRLQVVGPDFKYEAMFGDIPPALNYTDAIMGVRKPKD